MYGNAMNIITETRMRGIVIFYVEYVYGISATSMNQVNLHEVMLGRRKMHIVMMPVSSIVRMMI